MIRLHYLENSRSQRIVWLLEELELEYELVRYERDKDTNLAPSSLKDVHPLGRAPILTVDDKTIAESAAIIEFIITQFDESQNFQEENEEDIQECKFWMHFSEGSLMPSMLTNMVLREAEKRVVFPVSLISGKFVDAVIAAYYGPNLATSLDYVESHLAKYHGFVGDGLTGADFQMIFPLEAFVSTGKAENYPAISAYVKRIHQRDAYKRGLAKVGCYIYATTV